MKKNLLPSIFVFTLILVGLFLLAGCQIEADVAAAAGKAGIVYAMDTVDLKLFNAASAAPTSVSTDQARWDARGEFYTGHTAARSAEAINADQARWVARGELYTNQASALSAAALNADQARWDARGEFYTG